MQSILSEQVAQVRRLPIPPHSPLKHELCGLISSLFVPLGWLQRNMSSSNHTSIPNEP